MHSLPSLPLGLVHMAPALRLWSPGPPYLQDKTRAMSLCLVFYRAPQAFRGALAVPRSQTWNIKHFLFQPSVHPAPPEYVEDPKAGMRPEINDRGH